MVIFLGASNNFQAWEVMEFIMISIFRPGKSWNLLCFQFSGLESHGIYYAFNFQAWKVREFK